MGSGLALGTTLGNCVRVDSYAKFALMKAKIIKMLSDLNGVTINICGDDAGLGTDTE